ncbi:MAG: RagB/SusD family nutrient uptake outer membrane protein [Flavobacteriaceae bacterium]|jgi:hypothetical protein|nr:RagB/SusD family nutrient uptake outer membrane protein [Flavobacteriaceae bacterium]
MKRIILFLSCLTVAMTTVSCDKYLDIEPQGKIIPKTVEDFRKVLTSAYAGYPEHKALSNLRTDELVLDPEKSAALELKDVYIYQDANPSKESREFAYDQFYKVIYYANQTINGGSTTMEDGVEKKQILGEAHALRAMAYFDLANLYAKPYDKTIAATQPCIVIQNELDIENKRPKSTMAEVYAQIHSDINDAKFYLQVSNYDLGKNYRYTKTAIAALEARVYLYQKEYDNALNSAEQVLSLKSQLQNINKDKTYSVADFRSVESILALEQGMRTGDNGAVTLSKELIDAYDKEQDLRFTTFFTKKNASYVNNKTANGNAKASFRTADIYLIKAEALAHLNRLSDAKEVVGKLIDSRYTETGSAQLKQKIANYNQQETIDFILDERYREFAFEGHRWFDLRRANQKEIVHDFSGTKYILRQNDPRYTLPFPIKARANNPNL